VKFFYSKQTPNFRPIRISDFAIVLGQPSTFITLSSKNDVFVEENANSRTMFFVNAKSFLRERQYLESIGTCNYQAHHIVPSNRLLLLIEGLFCLFSTLPPTFHKNAFFKNCQLMTTLNGTV